MKNLHEIHNGARVLVDANVLLYARRGVSPQCRAFVQRCQGKAVQGVITPLVLAEFCERRMLQEAQANGFPTVSPPHALLDRPDLVRSLSVYAKDTRALLSGELELTSLHLEDFLEALSLQKLYGLLTIDSINLAVARRLGLNEVVSADSAFDRVQGLMIYKPEDIITS